MSQRHPDQSMLGAFQLRETVTKSPVAVDVIGRSYPHADSADDADWLNATVSVDIEGFTGRFSAYIGVSDLMSLRSQVARVYETLKGSIRFEPLEPHLRFTGTVDPTGHVSWDVVAQHPVGYGATLAFNFESDRSSLRPLVRDLDQVIESLGLIPEMDAPSGDPWLVDPDGEGSS